MHSRSDREQRSALKELRLAGRPALARQKDRMLNESPARRDTGRKRETKRLQGVYIIFAAAQRWPTSSVGITVEVLLANGSILGL